MVRHMYDRDFADGAIGKPPLRLARQLPTRGKPVALVWKCTISLRPIPLYKICRVTFILSSALI